LSPYRDRTCTFGVMIGLESECELELLHRSIEPVAESDFKFGKVIGGTEDSPVLRN
jgi:hypothetical protein